MIGFKQIQDMTLEECYGFLQQNEGDAAYEEVKNRYEQLVSEVQKQENKDYKALKTINDYDGFIYKYSAMAPAYNSEYLNAVSEKKQLLVKAAQEEEIKRRQEEQEKQERDRKRNKRIILITAATLLMAALIVFFIGYEPVRYLNIKDVEFGKEGGVQTIRVETNVDKKSIDISSINVDWVTVKRDNYMITFTATANPDPERTCQIKITAYATFFGDRIDSSSKTRIMIIKQRSGYAKKLNVDKKSLKVGKYGDTYQINVKTDGVQLALNPSDNNWIKYTPKNQNHDGQWYHDDTYDITIEKNPTGNRTGTIIIQTGGKQETISITQESGLAKKFDVDTKDIHFANADGNEYRKVKFDTDGTVWSVTKPDWIKVSDEVFVNNTTRDKYVQISSTYNATGFKQGKVVFHSNNGHTKEIKVSQEGGPSNMYAYTKTWYPGTSSDSKTIKINNDSHYAITASSNRDWITTSVSGDNVIISCTSTRTGYKKPREGTVTVKCRNATCTISVKQDGYEDCDKCGGDGKCKGGQWVANPYGWGGEYKHAWQVYGAIGQHYEAYYGMPGGYWVTDYGWTWQYCSQCGGSGKCNKCDGTGKISCSY